MASYIYRTPAEAGSNSVFTLSFWFKRSKLGALQTLFSAGPSSYGRLIFDTSDTFAVYDGATLVIETTRVFRDPSAWMHLVLAYDTSESGTDKVKLYINGVQETDFSTDNRSTAGPLNYVNDTEQQNIGADTLNYFFGYMSWVQMVDGAQLAPTEFGSTDGTSGIWTVKTTPYATPGTNGFCLAMEDSTNLALDTSSNAFTWSTSGELTASVDNPSNNFCNISNVYPYGASVYPWYDAASQFVGTQGNAWRLVAGSLAVSSGKYYYELKINTAGTNNEYSIGWTSTNNIPATVWVDGTLGYGTNGPAVGLLKDATLGYSTSTTNTQTDTGWTAYASGDIICCAIDLTNNFMYFGKDGTWMKSGDPTSGATGTGGFAFDNAGTYWWTPAFGSTETASGSTVHMSTNFGNGTFANVTGAPSAVASPGTNASELGIFEYDVPTGYTAICTKGFNL